VSHADLTLRASTGPQSITFTARVTDDLMGTQQVYFYLTRPDGNTGPVQLGTMISGTPLDGVYQAVLTVLAGSPSGAWKIYVDKRDAVGNSAVSIGSSDGNMYDAGGNTIGPGRISNG